VYYLILHRWLQRVKFIQLVLGLVHHFTKFVPTSVPPTKW
jgi:hypothetical protein